LGNRTFSTLVRTDEREAREIHMSDYDTIPNSQPTETTSPAPAQSTPAELPPPRPKQRRGFAAMDPRLVAEIASKGGKAAHAAGTAHEFSADEARAAGRKGGLAPHTRRRGSKAPPAV
jgi:general stress protein YciG